MPLNSTYHMTLAPSLVIHTSLIGKNTSDLFNESYSFFKNLAVSMFCVASCFQLQAQQTPLSEIFFLDLGIVIEPSNGNNKFSRTVDKPSEEVAFKVKRAESGSVYMASSEELLSTLDRLNDRIENLEQSFKDEIASMKERNDNLQNLLVSVSNKLNDQGCSLQLIVKATASNDAMRDDRNNINISVLNISSNEDKIFDQSLYMSVSLLISGRL